jgi:2,3-bisphosphoglycerate-independent phosphoglycerate mutase
MFLEPVRDYRFVLVLRGESLGAAIEDTDPGRTGVPPLEPVARDAPSERTAALLRNFIEQAASLLADEHPANMITLRGIARRPPMPTFEEVYRLRAGAIAVYPMYRGLARLVGMSILPAGGSWAEQVERLRENWHDYDFFFLHYKYTDAAGEDGDFARKVKCIEEFDAQIAGVMELRPDVVIVTGDHSTPASWRNHSWHPVPVLLAARTCRPDAATRFGEDQCLRGGLGQIEAKYLMPLALAHAGRLGKYGA